MPTPAAYDPATDPATMSGARNDPNYIGPTNFSNLQKQYTPYQIEQATERRGNDIFWRQGVDIASVPTAAPATNLQPPAQRPPAPAAVLGTPAPVVTAPNPSSAEFDARNRAAASYLQGMQLTIDDIQKQQEARLAEQKAQQEGVVKGLKDKLSEFMNGTDYQDSLSRDRELFQVEKQIRDLGEIRTKIADAQNALNQGLIFEEGRPTRMELLTGRSAELKKQGLAHIQALQSTAEIIKGNIDLARAYADDSIDAIKMDNDKKINALNTLLDLENKSLISISDDEKATVKERMNRLKEEADRIAKEKDKVFDLATENPQAFSKGGVTFRDTLDQAITKMLPFLTEEQKLALEKKRLENELLQSQILENKAQAAKAARTGTGTGTGTGASDGSLQSQVAASVQLLRDNNYPEDQIRTAILRKYGGALKTTELTSLIDNALQGSVKPLTPQQEQDERLAKRRNDQEAKGLLFQSVSTGDYEPSPNADQIRQAEAAGIISWNGNNWVAYEDTVKGYNIEDPSKIRFSKDWLGRITFTGK